MSAVWKTHGSDAVPELMVKIIRSKHCRYLTEKPKIKENENLKPETQTVLQKSVTGNAKQMSRDPPQVPVATDHQINHDTDDVESKHEEKNQKPENNQKLLTGALRFLDGRANVHCSSVPAGDQSLSYIDGLPRRKLRDWSLEQMAKGGSDQPEDIGQKQSGTTKEDTFILTLIRLELKPHPLSTDFLDKLQKELKVLDPVSSGWRLRSQLSHLLLRHEVPLQLPTVRVLCQRFSGGDSPETCRTHLECDSRNMFSQRTPELPVSAQKSLRLSPAPPSCTAPQDSNSQSEMNKSLLEILKMALRTTNGNLNLESLNLSLQKEDCSFSGSLPPPRVRLICGKHGLYVTLSLLETLLHHQDLAYQHEIKQKFVELLSKASSDLSSDLPTGKEGKETSATSVQAEVPTMSQGETEHMVCTWPENLPAETSAPKVPQGSLMIRPVSQPFVSPAMKSKSAECETWINRFRKLESVLYPCDLSNTGDHWYVQDVGTRVNPVMTSTALSAGQIQTLSHKEFHALPVIAQQAGESHGILEKEAQRLIHSYNLIYNLSLSPQKIHQALRRFRSGENMLLEPALRYLKEL
ncbi:LOW QUALITY PROTEIN: uncharacterized protein C1orf87 homolog [Glossophaga mutica]